jgi:hypothetical protein
MGAQRGMVIWNLKSNSVSSVSKDTPTEPLVIEQTKPKFELASTCVQPSSVVALVTLYLVSHYTQESAEGITFDDSAALAVAAWEHGIAPPPGFPAWTLLSGAFARVVPFGSIATRLILFSSLCAALACGIVSWCVLHLGLFSALCGRTQQPQNFRIGIKLAISAIAAGVLLGHSKAFAYEAGRISVHSLTTLLYAAGIAFAIKASIGCHGRWMLLLSALCFGLVAGNDHRILMAIPVIQLIWVTMDLRTGRDILGISAALAPLPILLTKLDSPTLNQLATPLSRPLLPLALTGAFGFMILGLLTKSVGTRWRQALGVVLCFLAPFLLFALLPMRSFGNPPLDWSFTRTWTGFLLHITRAQYAEVPPALDIAWMGKRIIQTMMDLGPLALLAPLPLLRPKGLDSQRRRMVVGICVGGFLHTAIASCWSNPASSGQSWIEVSSAYLPSMLLLSVAIGVGLSMAARLILDPSEGS